MVITNMLFCFRQCYVTMGVQTRNFASLPLLSLAASPPMWPSSLGGSTGLNKTSWSLHAMVIANMLFCFLQCYVTMGVQSRNFASLPLLSLAASPPMWPSSLGGSAGLSKTSWYLHASVITNVLLFSAMLCHHGCSNKKLCITSLCSSITANVTIIFGRVSGPEQNILIFAYHGYCEYVVVFSAMLCHHGCSNKKRCITSLCISITANVTIIFGRVSGPEQNILIFAYHCHYEYVVLFSAILCHFGFWETRHIVVSWWPLWALSDLHFRRNKLSSLFHWICNWPTLSGQVTLNQKCYVVLFVDSFEHSVVPLSRRSRATISQALSYQTLLPEQHLQMYRQFLGLHQKVVTHEVQQIASSRHLLLVQHMAMWWHRIGIPDPGKPPRKPPISRNKVVSQAHHPFEPYSKSHLTSTLPMAFCVPNLHTA